MIGVNMPLKGNQHKIDLNKDGKITREDFNMMNNKPKMSYGGMAKKKMNYGGMAKKNMMNYGGKAKPMMMSHGGAAKSMMQNLHPKIAKCS
tara:strand:+ start:6059 stop:6331 length:273 start_codon:yes stop_codon:yes gene_type:complete